jgi:hypothetical protein
MRAGLPGDQFSYVHGFVENQPLSSVLAQRTSIAPVQTDATLASIDGAHVRFAVTGIGTLLSRVAREDTLRARGIQLGGAKQARLAGLGVTAVVIDVAPRNTPAVAADCVDTAAGSKYRAALRDFGEIATDPRGIAVQVAVTEVVTAIIRLGNREAAPG